MCSSIAAPHRDVKVNGFTLVEVLVAVLILGVLMLVAVPGFSDLISNNRMVSEVYALRATLSHARSEALARRTPVVVCPTNDGVACADSADWSIGYMARVGGANVEVIQWEDGQNSVAMLFDNAKKQVIFGGQGIALDYEGTFTFCDDRGQEYARALILNPVGSLRAGLDIDSPPDDIVNALGRANVVCN